MCWRYLKKGSTEIIGGLAFVRNNQLLGQRFLGGWVSVAEWIKNAETSKEHDKTAPRTDDGRGLVGDGQTP